jgi:hypothetical protein
LEKMAPPEWSGEERMEGDVNDMAELEYFGG